ncbi:MAG: mannonate dehydratase [Kiloniellaceae bacterium]
MYIGEQIINPTAERLRLSTQLGVGHVVLDTRPATELQGADGCWDPVKVTSFRRWVEGFGLAFECLALDVGSFLIDTIYDRERANWRAERLRGDIRAAATGGLTLLKYNLQMVGITRTGRRRGRGGVLESAFRAADYSVEADRAHSYWGVGHPGGGAGADIAVNAVGTAEAVGQVVAEDIRGVSADQAWLALEELVGVLVPAAEQAGIRLAAHPHDPAFPKGGLSGVEHVVGCIEGMERFLDLAPESQAHGINFCQGTVAEMSPDPALYVLEAIRRIGGRGRIYIVHFRNIKGGFCDFSECFPDEGDVDMAAAVRAYRQVGYQGILCPDHVPFSDLDPARERFFAFALGYTKGLLDAT